jgi:hypothetical protein
MHLFSLTQTQRFTQNYVNYTLTFNDHIVVYWKGARVNAKSWPVVIKQARKELVSLELSQRYFFCYYFSTLPYYLSANKGRKRYITHGVVDEVNEDSRVDIGSLPYAAGIDGLSAISEADFKAAGIPNDGMQSSNLFPNSSKSQGGKSDRKSPSHHRADSTNNNPPDLQTFHILVWVAIRQAQSKPAVDDPVDGDPKRPLIGKGNATFQNQREIVDIYLNTVHIWLENQKDRKLMAAYRKASSKSLIDVEQAFLEVPKSDNSDSLDEDRYETTRKSFLKATKSIFSLFIPLDQQGPMCSRVWGSLYDIATVRSSTHNIPINWLT